jgi:hypothetical protein
MTAAIGDNLGLVTGWAPGDDGWGAAMDANLRRLNGLTWFTTKVAPLNTPPVSPTVGDRYIVGTSPTGAWATHTAALAVYQTDEAGTSAWAYYAPKEGWKALVLDVSGAVAPVAYLYRGSAWAIEPATTWTGGTVTALGGGLGLSGGTLAADWHGGTVSALGGGLGLSGGTLSASVTTVAGRTGAVTIDVTDVTGAEATASKGASGGYAGLDGSAKVPLAQLPASVVGANHYLGTWNATTNSPALASGVGTTGGYYVVATAGTTTIDGKSVWGVGDWIVFDGTAWDKLDGQANPVSSVAGRQGAVTLAAADVSGLNGMASQTVPAAGLISSDGTILQPVTIGANVTFSGGTLSATGGTSGLNGIASQTVPVPGPIYSDGTLLVAMTLGANLSFNSGTLSVSGTGAGSVTSVSAGAGLSGGPITGAGTLIADWHSGTVASLGVNLSLTTGVLDLKTLSGTDPGVGGELWVTTSGQVAVSGIPPTIPLGIPIPGKPGAAQHFNIPVAAALSLPPSLAGTVVYDEVQTTANAVFTVNRITGGTTVTALGTITITSASHQSATLAGAGGALAVGDVLQIVCPTSQDATLSDVGITILATKV